jgi:hypothetical protein
MKHVATHNLQPDAKMGSVEWIAPSTLVIPVMRHNTRIKARGSSSLVVQESKSDINRCAGSQQNKP